MSVISNALVAAGAPITPLQQADTEVKLTWNTSLTGSILGEEVLVVLPDMHLGGGDAGDIFRGNQQDAARDRLSRFVAALAKVAPQFPTMSIVHLGDLYDVWRAYPQYRDHPTSDYRVIEDAYGESLGILLQDLGARVCVGNHDAALGLFPPAWARSPSGVTGQLAYGHRFAGGRVLAFHGHQHETLAEAMATEGGSGAVRLATEVAKLSNPLSMLIQRGVDLLDDMFSDSELSLSDLLNARWPEVDAPDDAHGFDSPRWCDRDGRDVLQTLVGALPEASALRLVVVGHSHRPGVSAIHIDGKLVPLVDVGSWVWGRAQIAIASEGELQMWSVV
jgi:UDP-2,3-diacylglucosamine pyrophosphatase LpxH